MVKRAEQTGDQGNNTACSSHASIPTTLPFNNNITETFSAKRKRLQSYIEPHNAESNLCQSYIKPHNAESNLCQVYEYDVPVNTSLPLRGLNTLEGYDPFCATKEMKDNKSPNKQKGLPRPLTAVEVLVSLFLITLPASLVLFPKLQLLLLRNIF